MSWIDCSKHIKSYELTWRNASETISCLLYKERRKLTSLEIKFNDAIAKERYTVDLIEDTKLILGKEFNEAKELISLKLPVELFQMYLKQYLGISSLEELERSIKSGKELKKVLANAHLPARSLIKNLGFKNAKKTDFILNKVLWNTYLAWLGRERDEGYSEYDYKKGVFKSYQIECKSNGVELIFEIFEKYIYYDQERKKLLSKYKWNIDRTGINLSYSMPLHLTPEPEIIEIEKSLKEKCQIAITALMSLIDKTVIHNLKTQRTR